MKTLYAMVSAVALTAAMAGTAGAVDIRDVRTGDGPMWDNYLTITENGQERHVVLMNGETIHGICSDCTIKVAGGNEVHASKDDMVEARFNSLTLLRISQSGTAASPRDTQEAMLRVQSAAHGIPKNDADADPFDGPEGAAD